MVLQAGEMEVDLEDNKELGEGKKWEQEQMLSAVFHFGSKDKPKAQEEYDLLVDQIEFVQALTMAGTKQVLCFVINYWIQQLVQELKIWICSPV